MNKDCDPFLYTEEKVAGGSTQKFGYVPCGAIANSLFNGNFLLFLVSLNPLWKYYILDTFKIWYQSNELTHSGDLSKDHSVLVKFIETGIAWETDKTTKFQNPEAAKNCGSFRANETVVSEAQMCWRNGRLWFAYVFLSLILIFIQRSNLTKLAGLHFGSKTCGCWIRRIQKTTDLRMNTLLSGCEPQRCQISANYTPKLTLWMEFTWKRENITCW